MSLKVKLFVIFALIAALIFIYIPESDNFKVGQVFNSESEFNQHVSDSGYIVLGKFNPFWPAEIYSIERAKDQITFEIPGNGTQSYPGYNGYSLMATVLKGKDDKYAGYVLRSKNK